LLQSGVVTRNNRAYSCAIKSTVFGKVYNAFSKFGKTVSSLFIYEPN